MNYIKGQLRLNFALPPAILTTLAITALWPFSSGEDVANARNNIIVGERTDFWGGFSQFFYSSFKMDEPNWHISLGLTQASMILCGTLIACRTILGAQKSEKTLALLQGVHFIATIFVLNLSRDATLLAFSWLGTSLIFNAYWNKSFQIIKLILGVFLFTVGLSFRPWLAIAFVPMIIGILRLMSQLRTRPKRSLALLIATMLVTVGPLALDLSSKKFMNLKDSFPEQQVMILDITSLLCLSSDESTQYIALSALQPISTSSDLSRERLCGQFYPQNWAATVFYSNPRDPALRMISVGEFTTYKLVRDEWVKLITRKPTQYLQLKFVQLSQLFLAGDSSQLTPASLRKIPLLPYEAIRALRLFSFLPILLLLCWVSFSTRIHVELRIRYAILSSYLLTIGIVTVAFIGDNQRYISWLPILLIFALLNAPRDLQKSGVP